MAKFIGPPSDCTWWFTFPLDMCKACSMCWSSQKDEMCLLNLPSIEKLTSSWSHKRNHSELNVAKCGGAVGCKVSMLHEGLTVGAFIVCVVAPSSGQTSMIQHTLLMTTKNKELYFVVFYQLCGRQPTCFLLKQLRNFGGKKNKIHLKTNKRFTAFSVRMWPFTNHVTSHRQTRGSAQLRGWTF